MVTATVGITVIDGEVIPVENTPPHPPPLPEPPPSIIDNNNNGYEYSVTSINGKIILMIQVLLFQTMYQVQVQDDDDNEVDGDADDTINDSTLLVRSAYQVDRMYQDHNNDDTIAVLQLVLYQDKYKTIRPFHLSTTGPATFPNTATTTVRRPLSSTVTAPDGNDDDTSQLVLYQDKYVLPSDN
jgi:hypothetical protein